MNHLINIAKQTALLHSEDLATIINIEHRSVIRLIDKHEKSLQKLGTLIKKQKHSTGGRPLTYYLLNLGQVTFLFTTFRNSEITQDVSVKLIQSFLTKTTVDLLNLLNSIDLDDIPADRFVYVAKESTSGRFKIGISKNPEHRIKQLNTGNPEKLILIHAYLATEAGNQSEQLAHKLFDEHRLHGEWFSNVDLNLLPSYVTEHVAGFDCSCIECTEYGDALDAIDDDMTAYEALTTIIEKTNQSFEKAKHHVEIMLELGMLTKG